MVKVSHSYRRKNKLKKHEKISKNNDLCYPKMPHEDKNILKYNPGEKSLKARFLEKTYTCHNNPEKSYTEKKAKYLPLGYLLVTCCSYDKSKNERKYYRGEDCMEMLSKDLKEQAMKIFNHEKKEIIPLTNEGKVSYKNQKTCFICEKEFSTDKKI